MNFWRCKRLSFGSRRTVLVGSLGQFRGREESVWYRHIFRFGMLDEILEFSFSTLFGVDVAWSASLLF